MGMSQRHLGHSLVDISKGESRRIADDAASDGVLAPVLIRVQAIGLSSSQPQARGERNVTPVNAPPTLSRGRKRSGSLFILPRRTPPYYRLNQEKPPVIQINFL